MSGKHGVRKALAVTGAAAVLAGLAAIGLSPADARVTAVNGEAYGVEGLITLPPEVDGDPPETIEIEPIPAVVLPAGGGQGIIEQAELGFVVPGFAAIDIMRVSTQGALSTGNVEGGVFSETLLDNVDLLDGLIEAEELRSSCLHEPRNQITAVSFDELEIAGESIAQSPPPNTVVVIPDVGEARLNVVEEGPGRIQVIAMELEFELDDGPSGSMRLGLAECGTEVLDVVDDRPFVPQADLADAFSGDPEFTG